MQPSGGDYPRTLVTACHLTAVRWLFLCLMSRRQSCAVHGAKRRLSTIKGVKKRPAGKALQKTDGRDVCWSAAAQQLHPGCRVTATSMLISVVNRNRSHSVRSMDHPDSAASWERCGTSVPSRSTYSGSRALNVSCTVLGGEVGRFLKICDLMVMGIALLHACQQDRQ